jgi:hypothetical protein
MMLGVWALSAALVAATGFGPPAGGRHPMVGPAAPVPGNGPEPPVSPAPEEVSLQKARGKAGPIRARGSSNPLYLLFLVYKNFLTEVDGGRCQHYPTCSAYGAQAVGRHNVLGVLMTMERLWAGSNSSSVRPLRLVYGIGPTPRFYDPVEDTSFFFSMPLIAWLGPSVATVDRARGRTANAPEPDAPAPPAPRR